MEDSFTVTDQVYGSSETFAIIDSKLPYSNDLGERQSESQSVDAGEESNESETEGEGQTILGSAKSNEQGADSPPVSPSLSVDPDELTVSDLADLSSLDEEDPKTTTLPVDFETTQQEDLLSSQEAHSGGAATNDKDPTMDRSDDPFASCVRESALKDDTPAKGHWARSVALKISGGLVLLVALWCLFGTPPLHRQKTELAPSLVVPVKPAQPTVSFPSRNGEASFSDIEENTPSQVQVMPSDETVDEDGVEEIEHTVASDVTEPEEETNKKMTRQVALNVPQRLKLMSWAHVSSPNSINFSPVVTNLLGWKRIVDWARAVWRVLYVVVMGLIPLSMLWLSVALCGKGKKQRGKRLNHHGHVSKMEVCAPPKKERGVAAAAAVVSCQDVCSILEHCHNSLRRNGRRSSLYVDKYGLNVSAYDRLSKKDLHEICIQLGAEELYVHQHSKPQIIDSLVEHYDAILMGLSIPEIKTVLSTNSVQYNQKMKKRHLVELALEAAF